MQPKTKLKVYDFDGTLVFTPSPTSLIEGVPALQHYDQWLESQGMPKRKWQGWWGRKETLMPPIFGIEKDGKYIPPPEALNQEVFDLLQQNRQDDQCLNILLTGRHGKMKLPSGNHCCRVILDAYGAQFDDYFYNTTGRPTLTFKCHILDTMIQENPTIEDVEIFEDRPDHVSKFWEWIKYRKIQKRIASGSVVQIHEEIASYRLR